MSVFPTFDNIILSFSTGKVLVSMLDFISGFIWEPSIFDHFNFLIPKLSEAQQ